MKLICFFVPRFRNTTKKAFLAYAIQLMHQHWQLFTHHHVAEATEAVEATIIYRRNTGIVFNSSSNESNEGAH
jgi:hypothetical protein